MNMKLIFGALAIFAVAMILLAGSGVFWVTNSALDAAKQESTKALAGSLAYTVSSQMQLFEQTVEQIATDADVVTAIASGDGALIESAANKVQKLLPIALKVRLLPASVNAIDEQHVPFMGYADLEMVKKTLSSKQVSIIQGEGTNRHLAVTAPIKRGNQVLGVVLASLKFDFLTAILAKAPIKGDFISIDQGSVVLSVAGDQTIKSDNPRQLKIANSPWQVSYVYASPHQLSDIGIIMGLVITLAALAALAQFLGYFYMAGLLKKDQNTILEAVKNLMTGKELGTYVVKLSEMQIIISTLVQFKRILDNKSGKDGETHEQTKSLSFDEANLFSDTESSRNLKSTAAGLFKKKK
jgi:phosphomannomutase/phosphoglucomutase